MKSFKAIKRAVEIESNYFKGLKKNWLSPEEQKELKNLIGFTLTNDMRAALELHYFKKEKPNKYFAYISEDENGKYILSLWTGVKIGSVFMGREYRNNFGDTRVNFDCIAITGEKYHGIYFKSAGDYARITKYKKEVTK